MGLGRKKGPGGGGAALNFKVVPGLTQPGTASENTIWVKTEKIGAWYFSSTQPEGLQEWDVLFQTGDVSDVEFNALKKNAVQVYPLNAKQMVDGSLMDVDAMIYQNSEWHGFWLELFPGNEYLGKWVGKPYGSNEHAADNPARATPSVSISDSEITAVLNTYSNGNYYMGSLFYDISINFKNRRTITVKYSHSLQKASSTSSEGFVVLRVGKTMTNSYAKFASVVLPVGTDKTVELNVSGLGDVDGYIAFEMYAGHSKNTLSIEEIKIS